MSTPVELFQLDTFASVGLPVTPVHATELAVVAVVAVLALPVHDADEPVMLMPHVPVAREPLSDG